MRLERENSEPRPPAPTPAAAPHPKPPRWLTALFPALRGIESNPLYLRLSGEAFIRKRRWRGRPTPPELKFRRGGTSPAAGCSALVLLFLCPPIGIPILLFHVAAGGAARDLKNFIVNGGAEPWGEDLILSGLTPEDIERALHAALLRRQLGRLAAIAVGSGAILGFWVLFVGISLTETIYTGELLEILGPGALAWAVLLAELLALSLLRFVGAFGAARSLGTGGMSAFDFGATLQAWVLFATGHAFGIAAWGLAAVLWSAAFHKAWDGPLGDAAATCCIIAPAAFISIGMARDVVARARAMPRAAWALKAAIRRRHGDDPGIPPLL